MLGIITTRDIITYIVLSRKKKELEFKKEYLSTTGKSTVSLDVIDSALKEVEDQLTPLEMKILSSGITVLQLHKTQIEKFTEQIKSHTIQQLEEALTKKEGELYDTIMNRAQLLKENLNKKEELAELTILINTLPTEINNRIKTWVEDDISEGQVDLSGLPEEKRDKLLNLLNRLGIRCYIDGDRLVLGSPGEGSQAKTWTEEEVRYINDEKVWIPKDKVSDFDRIVKELDEVTRKIQAITAKKQVVPLTDEEKKEFTELQNRYIQLVKERDQIISG